LLIPGQQLGYTPGGVVGSAGEDAGEVVLPALGATACRSPLKGVTTLRRSTTTRSRSFHNELYGRLERRKRQLVALDARNPTNELSDVLVI